MKIAKLNLFIVLTAVFFSSQAFCLDLEKDFRRDIALYHVRPDQARSLKQDSNGTPVSETRLQQAAKNFYDRLYPLDPAFLKRCKIREVVFKDTVDGHDGHTYQYNVVDGALFLDADLEEKEFYANIFCLQIPLMPRTWLTRWNKLNPDGFVYEKMRGSLSSQAQKKLDAILADWDKYFVSRTGMYATEMDMAMTFAYMVLKGPDAAAFAREKSPTIQKKIDLMVDILESVKAVEPGYMQTLLSEDLSRLKTYSPHALSVRLFREFSGEWTTRTPAPVQATADAAAGNTAAGNATAGNAAETAAKQKPRTVNDPVEVAGRKIVPLALALEAKDMRFFTFLLENKADPNKTGSAKTDILSLAIANNDPEPVKLLLEAGAKVTPEAARAGTASGVNAEIVKIMTPYMPGVRRTEAPEKKKSGGTGASRKAQPSGSSK